MSIGIQTQIALAREQKARAAVGILARRLNVIETMLHQFKTQCQAVPEGDPARVVVETMIIALQDVIKGGADVPQGQPRIILPS